MHHQKIVLGRAGTRVERTNFLPCYSTKISCQGAMFDGFAVCRVTARKAISVMTLLFALVLGLGSSLAVAGPRYDAYSPQTESAFSQVDPSLLAEAASAGDVLKEGIGKLIRFMKQDSAKDRDRLRAFLEQKLSPYFDFSYMARWAAGAKYRYMTHTQREGLDDQLKGMFMSAMLRHLSDYRHAEIQYLPPRRNRSGGIVLGILVVQEDRPRRRLEFHMFRTTGFQELDEDNKGWKVVDVVSDGQSALAYYRWYFSRTDSKTRRPFTDSERENYRR